MTIRQITTEDIKRQQDDFAKRQQREEERRKKQSQEDSSVIKIKVIENGLIVRSGQEEWTFFPTWIEAEHWASELVKRQQFDKLKARQGALE